MKLDEQYSILFDLIANLDKSTNIEEYLKDSIEIMYKKIDPLSIAGYISIETEEKLILICDYGENFDQLISPVYDFSVKVRKAMMKRDVVYIPEKDALRGKDLEITIVLIPVVHSESNIGMIGIVFENIDFPDREENRSLFIMIGRILGLAGQLNKVNSQSKKIETIDPDEDHSEKIMSLGVLSTGVAHEFNNILAAIKGNAELIMIQHLKQDEIKKAFKVIDEQTERGAELIERLNIFAKGKVDKLSYHSLKEIIDEAVILQKKYFEKENIKFVQNYGEIPKILVDRNQIKVVIINILLNSRHALRSNNGGILDIKTDYVNERVILSVKDNGIGMTKEHADIAINPFFTTKGALGGDQIDDKRTGTGLGLAIAYGIMESHGGNITISSEPEIGTEVKVFFSRTELGEGEYSKYQDREMVYFGNTRILIVDDEDAIRNILYSALTNCGYQVISVACGEDAVEICSVENIDIVFLDYLMPGIRGDKAFESIKKVCPETDVVFITGAHEIPDIQKHLNKGLAYVLKKPFKIEKLLKITNDLISKRLNKKNIQ